MNRERYLRRLIRWADEHVEPTHPQREALARAVGVEVARLAGRCVPLVETLAVGGLPEPGGPVDPCLPGEAWARLRPAGEWRRRGAVATPPAVARRVVELALACHGGVPRSVWDPAVGGGVFLVAVADALVDRGLDPDLVLSRLRGIDTDPVALAFAEAALRTWATDHAAGGDVLLEDGEALTSGLAEIDLVVGNPPFRGQLGRSTRHDRGELEAARLLLGSAAGYADTAGLFLVRATEALGPNGVAALVQPQSLLAARDAEPVRARVLEEAALVGLWLVDSAVFSASVHTCVPILRRGARAEWTELHGGLDATPVRRSRSPEGSQRWSGLAADARSVPTAAAAGEERACLGDVAEVTADFRDAFYEVAAAVEEWTVADVPSHLAPVITAGSIDPAVLLWGRRPARIGGGDWMRPVVEVGRLGDWARRRRVAKVMVATQTRVIEAVADPGGMLLPLTPVVTVGTDASRCWHVLAALSDPWATAWALREAGGAARSPGALKVSAALLRALPLPAEGPEWDAAAATLQHGEGVLAAAPHVLAARGVPDEEADRLLGWWRDRLPVRDVPMEQVPRPTP